MIHHSAPSMAAMALAASLTVTGCGSSDAPAKPFPGVGQPNPNGHGLIVSEGAKSPAQTAANAKRDDIHSLKEFKELTKNCHSLADFEKLLGPFQVALTGPYAGYAVYPNYYYDGWFVQSVALYEPLGPNEHAQLNIYSDLRHDAMYQVPDIFAKTIEYIRPEQMSWFLPPVEKATP